MLAWWTIGRASGIGASAGLAALFLWLLYRYYGEPFMWPLFATAGLAGLCGLSVLTITAGDLLFHRRRGERLRPLRVFDVALGAGLVALSLVELQDLAGQLAAVTRS
jgi:hypothetical protein